ncbi:CHAT domain-containing protein [Nitrosomonas ureae]|uniref:CHAT domain-containing protein n=1 Tax=Nitrosomonas ureae TaxID=44577 RepID=UPI000D75AFF9|nr:CHAT domain-containing protein [Nitrosomonas ureae]PXX14303.1 CHAT domain-containing protein [Nitrosomonas ureae]
MKTVLIHLLLILLLFGCAQTGQKTSITVHSDNSQAQAADLQQAMLEQARTFRQSHPELFGEAKGVLVTAIVPDSQGEKAGLKSGDILLTYGNTFLNSKEHLVELTGTKAENDAVTLSYLRNRKLYNAALKGGRIGVHILSLIPSEVELSTQQMQLLRESGNEAHRQSRFKEALQQYQLGLEIASTQKLNYWQSVFQKNLGDAYVRLGQYSQALDHYQQSLATKRELVDRKGESLVLHALGVLYAMLDEKNLLSLDYFLQSLAIAREINNRDGEATNLQSLGVYYHGLRQYPEALDYYQQSLAISRELEDRQGEARSLFSIGLMHIKLDKYPQALDYHMQSLAIEREIGNDFGIVANLLGLGILYLALDQSQQALDVYRQAMIILTQVNVPELIWRAWHFISIASYYSDQIHAAILAGKQAVNTLQGLRAGNLTLTQNLQQSFLVDKTFVYNLLAKMLIEQGRLTEAEQVMAMLKEEEYFDFIQRDGKDDMRTIQAGYTQVESNSVKRIDQFSTQLVSLGKEYDKLTHLSQIDEQAKTRLTAVEKELEHAQDQFLNLLSSLEEYFKQVGGDKAVEFGERQLAQLERQQDLLRKHQSAIVTTVATKDKLHLILTTPEVQLARESAITEKDLNDLVKRFRNALKHPGSNPVPLAQELYVHLVKPLEKDLQQTQAKTLMWSLDGVLRYIPLATLHDGQQFLIEKYNLSLYTAAAQNNLHENNVSAWRAAGLGVSQAHPGFEALPGVPTELRNIIRQNDNDPLGVLPGEIHLDKAFNRDSFKSVIRAGFPVLHIASHFKLQPGDGSLSTLLLGDGDLLSLDEFRRQAAFKLHGVDLLTLSACDTAVGDKGTGGEVESFAVMAQLRGANGVLASLWRVEDESTGLLMKRLYRLRSENMQLSKAEALRQAQIAMLKGDLKAKENGHDFRHPYFWAPFVMMGNWL